MFRDVPVSVSADYPLELHLDADEARTAGLKDGDHVMLRARLRVEPAAAGDAGVSAPHRPRVH